MLVDSHAHIDSSKFDGDRAEMLERAWAAGLTTILAIGNGDHPGTFDRAIRLADNDDRIWATLGIHPHEAQHASEAGYKELADLARRPKVVAWGEIGLDYYYDHSPREVQQQVFRRQMELAAAAGLPIIIHCRPSDNSENAWNATLTMLREHWAPTRLPGVLHCFTGDVKHMEAALAIGFYISFAGNVTFPKAENIREAARQCSLERMLVETDCPYLAPIPHRGKRNEPAFVARTAEFIAELRGLPAAEIADCTARNFEQLIAVSAKKRAPCR